MHNINFNRIKNYITCKYKFYSLLDFLFHGSFIIS